MVTACLLRSLPGTEAVASLLRCWKAKNLWCSTARRLFSADPDRLARPPTDTSARSRLYANDTNFCNSRSLLFTLLHYASRSPIADLFLKPAVRLDAAQSSSKESAMVKRLRGRPAPSLPI
jgi:hypothetical protein